MHLSEYYRRFSARRSNSEPVAARNCRCRVVDFAHHLSITCILNFLCILRRNWFIVNAPVYVIKYYCAAARRCLSPAASVKTMAKRSQNQNQSTAYVCQRPHNRQRKDEASSQSRTKRPPAFRFKYNCARVATDIIRKCSSPP